MIGGSPLLVGKKKLQKSFLFHYHSIALSPTSSKIPVPNMSKTYRPQWLKICFARASLNRGMMTFQRKLVTIDMLMINHSDILFVLLYLYLHLSGAVDPYDITVYD